MEVLFKGRPVPYDLAGSAPETIVLLPALGASTAMWDRQINAFRDEFTVIAPETGGHSATFPPEPTLLTISEMVLAVIDAVGVQQAHFVGLSLGGMVAQTLAIHAPDRVRSLVLACTTAAYPETGRQQFRRRADTAVADGMAVLAEPAMERWFTAGFRSKNPDIVESARTMLVTADVHAYAGAARAVAGVDTRESLCRIAAPALVISAEFDQSMPAGAGNQLADLVPNAVETMLPGVSHLCNVQDPEQFNAVVMDFIRRVIDEKTDGPGSPPLMAPW